MTGAYGGLPRFVQDVYFNGIIYLQIHISKGSWADHAPRWFLIVLPSAGLSPYSSALVRERSADRGARLCRQPLTNQSALRGLRAAVPEEASSAGAIDFPYSRPDGGRYADYRRNCRMMIVGFLVALLSILVGFTIAGGQLLLLLQWAEFLIIAGTAIGATLISTPFPVLKKVASAVFRSFRTARNDRKDYLQLLKTFSDLFMIAQKDGLLKFEEHVEDPRRSEILSRNRRLLANEFTLNFVVDTLKVLLTGGVPAHELESLMDADIEAFELESRPVVATLNRVADSLPGIGIVAAVLSIIVTMSSINQGAEFVGRHVAAALVGTFLGVLLCYGFVGPLATRVEHSVEAKIQYLEMIKTCVTCFARGHSPILAVEIARRTIPSENRPSFRELENHIRGRKG
jgi:chemotaxis protein MotA